MKKQTQHTHTHTQTTMSLYPSLEDMQVDQMAKAQIAVGHHVADVEAAEASGVPRAIAAGQALNVMPAGGLYSNLGLEEMMSFAGLDISEGALVQHMPQDVAVQMAQQPQAIVALTSPQDLGMARAQVKQGVRKVILAKDQHNKLGMAVASIDKGLFVAFVWQNSAAALGGIRFGDQILQIDGQNVAGWTGDQALKFLRGQCDPQRIEFAIRDRPFERTITVVKDQANQIGFVFKRGEITHIVKDSSAARNGLLINHNLVEVNGQNVVGLEDSEVLRVMKESPRSVTMTVMPSFVFKHLVKKIGYKHIKKYMDHSIPEAEL
eukprot:m.127890 g.127890  ORF g.127890 m.127890 type:complete len:321 (-) comp16719_c2_seq1:252-1214(-)